MKEATPNTRIIIYLFIYFWSGEGSNVPVVILSVIHSNEWQDITAWLLQEPVWITC